MNRELVSALNFSFEKIANDNHYKQGFEIGLFLLKQDCLLNSNLKLLMVCSMKNNTRKILLNTLLEKEKKRELEPLEKGLVASLFYQRKNYQKCSEYALQYSRDSILSVDRKKGRLKVLILQTFASGAFNFNSKNKNFHMPEGHNNFMSVLDKDIQKVILRVDDLDGALEKLKQENINDFDIIYNSITDPDRCALALQNAYSLCDIYSSVPVINHPKDILLSTRDNNYERFHQKSNILYPKNIKLEGIQDNCYLHIMTAIDKHELSYPLIVRLSGYQGGKNMHLIDSSDSHMFLDFDALVAQEAKDIYLIEYKDVSFIDQRLPETKIYPKYRAFYAGGKLYPIHLFFSDSDFNVHLSNSEVFMESNPWLIEIEKAFCNAPEKLIGRKKWESLTEIMEKTGLDYVGVDFALSQKKDQDGIVIFEINAAMRNWMKIDRAPDHVKEAWKKVTLNMHYLLCSKSNQPVWEFSFL